MELTLTLEEAEFLRALLQRELGEVREEVYHADVTEFKERLKAEERLLRDLLSRMAVTV